MKAALEEIGLINLSSSVCFQNYYTRFSYNYILLFCFYSYKEKEFYVYVKTAKDLKC